VEREPSADHSLQKIGFLTEWQLYAQELEGDSWRQAKIDRGKIDKMSGWWLFPFTVYMFKPADAPLLKTNKSVNCTSLCKPFGSKS